MVKRSLLVFLLMSSVAGAGEAWQWLDDGADGDELTVLLMGDTNLQGRKNPPDAYRHVKDTLLAADIRFANLEVALAGHSQDQLIDDVPHKRWRHSEPDQVSALTSVGMDGVGVANNVNYPWQAVMKSLSVLDEAGVAHVGGGKNILDAHEPLLIKRKGVKVGFLQFAATVYPYSHAATAERPGIAEIKVHTAYKPPPQLDKPGQPPIVVTWPDEESLELMKQDIASLSQAADVVIVSYHWGVSNTTGPVSYQTEVGQAAIDAGADIVFGHGPHEYQRIDVYRHGLILHSLAQFVFDDILRRGKHREGLLVRALIRDKELASVSLVPSWLDDNNDVRLEDPNTGKGRELFGYLQFVNKDGNAELEIGGKEILIANVGR